jgi:ElaB/YqjD/DUF883 family membrane-anchored ribosome-binding protein
MLKDAVQAIYNKVATDLTNASPEELAYLSTSLEKLGGRATVYDVMDVGEDKKAEIQALATQVMADINLDASNHVAQFETDVQAIIDLQTQVFNTSIANTTTEYNTLVQTTTDSLNDTIAAAQLAADGVQQEVADAAAALTDAAAIANQQAINGSFFNLYLYGTLQV